MVIKLLLIIINGLRLQSLTLIAIMGYVKPDNQKKFENELKSRVNSMSSKEKEEYLKNLSKMKK